MFSSLGRQCPNDYNPAEYYLTQLASATSSNGDGKKDNSEFVDKCIRAFQQSTYNQLLMGTITDIKQIPYNELSFAMKYNEFISSESQKESELDSNFFRQMKWLLWRAFKSGARDPVRTTSLLLRSLIPAMIVGIIYFQSAKTPQTVQNSNAIVHITLGTNCITNSFVVLATFPAAMKIFLRERKRRLYNTGAYYLTKLIADLPFFILMPLLYSIIIYWLVGYRTDWRFFLLFCSTTVLATLASVAFHHIIAALAQTIDDAVSFALPFIETAVLFTGFMINNASIPIYFKWFQYATWFYYAFSVILIGLWAPIANIPSCKFEEYCFQSGKEVLQHYAIPVKMFWFDLTMLFVLIIAYHLIAFGIVLIRAKRS
ncbi:unnamed protein product [Didymodactylos carnosus]|uniref:ABC-2 type transporter transmembrane domain-containing protein n=1 Tax=Didymodactylos carnosus TaxID=1234261 RepID=A0A8S2U893_9BILA|nr:unnamed protein product [Didymodactylos carnosus]CAF4329372.1 unnamed protein product [Didymodactylos carnosus]